MGEYNSWKLIVGVMVYYLVFFLVLASIDQVMAQTFGNTNELRYTDPGFQDQFNFYESDGTCAGVIKKNILGEYYCEQFFAEDENFTAEDCEALPGCEYSPPTLIFNISIFDAACREGLNLTALSINESTAEPGNICSNFDNQTFCEAVSCVWLNPEDLAQQKVEDLEGTNFLTSIWENIKFVTTFSADFNMGGYDWVISLFFFYIPLLLLLYGVYMALPFLH